MIAKSLSLDYKKIFFILCVYYFFKDSQKILFLTNVHKPSFYLGAY